MIIYKALPYNNDISHYDLWNKFKHPDENIYKVNIPIREFVLTDIDTILNKAVKYFNKGFYYPPEKYVRQNNIVWQEEFEFYLKYVWLAEEQYFDRLKYPVGAHYNPDIKKIIMHPGTARNLIYNIFDIKEISSIFFNTGGIQFDWVNNAKIVSLEFLEFIYQTQIDFVVTADHGSLIPHLHFNKDCIDPNIKLTHEKIHNFLNNGGIKSNYKILDDIPFFNSSSNYSVEIVFDKEPSLLDKVRALVLWAIPLNEIKYDNIRIYKNV